ncbi:MAG: hypothetical protein GY950_11895 [bacterium]|nr:hypothetical protein [bacterium]
MRKIILVVLLVILLLTNVGFAAKVVPLPEIIKPGIINVDGDEMVIAEGTSISIYSLENFKRVKTFGKQGEGPREFKVFMGFGLTISFSPEYILVNSIGKISYFSRKGEFVKENKTSAFRMAPFQEKLVGTGMQFGQNNSGPKLAFNLYNGKGEKTKEICAHQLPAIKGKGSVMLIDLLSLRQVDPQYQTSADRIFIAGKETFEIDIYNQAGGLIKTVRRDYKKREITADDKNKILEVYKVMPIYKQFWENIKSGVKIPGYFPAFKRILVSGQKLYVQTFDKKAETTAFLIFDLDGKYLKTSFLPLLYRDIVTPYLYTIDGEKLYQLAENDDEEWELRISALN